MANEAYYTPGRHVHPLLDILPMFNWRTYEAWECAAGAGHVAREMAKAFRHVMATDIAPAADCVHPVSTLDFMASTGPSGRHPLAIITNPPYGRQNAQAIAFVTRALDLTQHRGGLVAMLLPFEFDAPRSRTVLVGEHPAFAAKITIGQRIRWVNLPQSQSQPMSHHSWFVWAWNAMERRLIQRPGVMRTV
jgi:hypothetical protein